MNTALWPVLATHHDDPDAMKRPAPLATLTPRKRVKLKLHQPAYLEAVWVLPLLTRCLAEVVAETPWLDLEGAPPRAALALLHDLWDEQLGGYQHQNPDLVTLTLSRAEGYLLWRVWAACELPATDAPSWQAVMADLHHLLS